MDSGTYTFVHELWKRTQRGDVEITWLLAWPISILPSLAKVFESQGNTQITDHFESHRAFSAMQSGFGAGHGCTSATLKVLTDIITAIDKRQYCAAVFIDLANAFDSVNHRILMRSLKWLPRLVHQLLLRWSSVCKIGGPVVRTSGSLYGGATGFNSWAKSFLCIYQWCHSCFWWLSDPPLRRRHHSVYFWPFFGHCVKPVMDDANFRSFLLKIAQHFKVLLLMPGI